MINNKKLNPIVTELLIRGRKRNITIVFITQSYFKVPKDVRLNSTHFFIMKILNKRELQQIALNHSSDIDFKDFMKIYKECTKEPYYHKRLDKIEELNNKIDYDNLKYVVEKSGLQYNFNKIKDPITFLNDISEGKISVEEAKEKQKDYYSYLNTIRRGNKNASQKRTLANINILFNARDNVIKYIEDYISMILEAKRLAREQEGTGVKILTSNQMFKRLPIALAQIKTGNNSESLLNEIRQILYYLYRSKKITKML